jgi:anti-anti-sigma factor
VAIVPGHFLLDRSKVLPPLSIRRLLEFAECMVLDLSRLCFLSSSGMYVLVTFNTATKQRGSNVVFAEVGPSVMEVFRICRLHKVFRIVETVDEGLEAFRLDGPNN